MTINEVQTRLEAIQQENPSMNAVTLFTEETELGTKICFNIMDLQGKPHTFFNDENIDVLNIYDELQARSKKQVNQNQLIGAINRKIHEVRIEAANKSNDENIEVVEEVAVSDTPVMQEQVVETPAVEEQVAETPTEEEQVAEIPTVEEQVAEIPGEEENIVEEPAPVTPVVEEVNVVENNEAVKPVEFVGEYEETVEPVNVIETKDEVKKDVTEFNVPVIEERKEQSPLFAEPVVQEMEQPNIKTPAVEAANEVFEQPIPVQAPIQENVVHNTVPDNKQIGRMPKLISIQEFYRILDVGAKLNEQTRMQVELWYAYLGELMIYEDFLNVELKDLLNSFRNYVIALQISDNMVLNMNQVEACERLYDLEERKTDYNIGMDANMPKDKNKAKVLTLTLTLQDNAAFVAYVQIFAIVFSIATLLSALVIFVLSK